MSKLAELQEKRNQFAADIRTLAEKFNAEGYVDNAEDQAAWAKVNASYDANQKEFDTEKKAIDDAVARKQAIDKRLGEINAHQDDRLIGRDGGNLDQPPVHKDRFDRGNQITEETQALAMQGWFLNQIEGGQISDQHVAAAKRVGLNLNARQLKISLPQNYRSVRDAVSGPMIDMQRFRNALSSQDGSTGGFTFGDSFVANLEKAMLAFGGMLQVSSVIRTTDGAPMRWPTANDTGNSGRQIGESQAVTTLDPSFGAVIWNAYKFTSDEILVPYELLQNNAVNLVNELPLMLGERLGRILNTKCTTGTGAGTPKGIVTCATAGVTAASATAIAYDELIDLEHSIDPSRRNLPGVGYMFHDNMLLMFRKLKNGNGDPLWTSGVNSGAPNTINGRPYTINQDMASAAIASAITVLFGQFPQYKIRQVNQIRIYRLVERHRENDQDAFLAFNEFDGNLLDSGDHPVKKLTQHS